MRPNTSMLFLRVDDTTRADEIMRRLRGDQLAGRLTLTLSSSRA
jgi:hypothetical protein